MKKKIAIVTGTRAEYGLLKNIIKKIIDSTELDSYLIVTGTHLSPIHGNTYKQIEEDGLKIDKKVDILLASDTPCALSKTMGLAVTSFAQVYEEIMPDILLILGDRYEIFAAATAAVPFNIIIAHIAGGEISEGAFDDSIRHAITKLSHIHFPCSTFAEENIKLLGEENWRIFNVGHPSYEEIRNLQLIEKEILLEKFNLDATKKILLVTLHPTTLNSEVVEKKEAEIFFNTLKGYNNENIIITYPNSDTNNQIIINCIETLRMYPNVRIVHNLGSLLYFSLMKICDIVVGNSSSGIGESTMFKVPVINYGDRQKGRIKPLNVIDVIPNNEIFKNAIDKALYNAEFKNSLITSEHVYQNIDTSDIVVNVLIETTINQDLRRKKLFRYV